jgi:hypothetical protein
MASKVVDKKVEKKGYLLTNYKLNYHFKL